MDRFHINVTTWMKRGQIAIFIIIGIFALVLFGLMMYFMNQQAEGNVGKQVDDIKGLFSEQGKMHTLITSCLNDATKQGLLLLGHQGGVIYSTQVEGGLYYKGPPQFSYGEFVLPYKDGNDLYEIHYGITAPEFTGDFHPPQPLYPYGITQLIDDPTKIDSGFVNTLGNYPTSPFPPLCDYYGLNNPNVTGAKYSCTAYDSKSEFDESSSQEYLEKYIASQVEECIDFTKEPDFAGLEITKSEARVKTAFSDTAVIATMQYDLSMERKQQEDAPVEDTALPEISVSDFEAVVPVRIRAMHELAKAMITADTNNIFFNMESDAGTLVSCTTETGQQTACLREGMKVLRKRDVCYVYGERCLEGEFDDVVIISDEQSVIDTESFVFQFAIENRPPALDLIPGNIEGHDYDYFIRENRTLLLAPIAYDPDEDFHGAKGFMTRGYVYAQWKESYDEYFDYQKCLEAGTEHCLLHLTDYQRVTAGQPRNFTNSTLFLETGINASYTMQRADTGLHDVQVRICDNGGLCDYQILKVMVLGGPLLNETES